MEDIFVRVMLLDKIKLQPGTLCKNKTNFIHNMLARKYEGTCSYHGYIKHGSISIVKIGSGMIKDVFLNGDVEYTITYSALVCNPAIGSTVRVKVINKNMFGILGEVSVTHGGISVPVLEVIVSKMTADEENVELDTIMIGDMVNVEILKKKFELGDDKIINVGRVIKDDVDKHIHDLDGGDANDSQVEDDLDVDDIDQEDEDEDNDDEDDEEEEEKEEDEVEADAADVDADAEEEEEDDEWSEDIDDDDIDDVGGGAISDAESI